jgi:hypothetical protein
MPNTIKEKKKIEKKYWHDDIFEVCDVIGS